MSISSKHITRSAAILVFCSLFAVASANVFGGHCDSGGDNPGGDNPGGDNPGGDSPGGNSPGGNSPRGNSPDNAGSSGSSEGGSGGGYGSNNQCAFNTAHISKSTYNRGKKVFFENIVCDSCLYADLELTPENVRTEWKQIRKDLRKKGRVGSSLERKERRSASRFILKRFICGS